VGLGEGGRYDGGMTFKAHFDGKTIVPDEDVALEVGCALLVSVRDRPHLLKRGKAGREIALSLRETPPIWQDVGESVEFAKKLREELGRSRYTIDPD